MLFASASHTRQLAGYAIRKEVFFLIQKKRAGGMCSIRDKKYYYSLMELSPS
jgi:hypothetical protein